jgi:AraC-like DNA-binding protein
MTAWTNAAVSDSGQPGSTRLQLTGVEGLRRLGGRVLLSAPDPGAFRAEVSRLALDNVSIGVFAATKHSGRCTPAQLRDYPERSVSALFTAEGAIQVRSRSETFLVEAGSLVLLPSDAAFEYETAGPVRVLGATIGAAFLPPGLMERGPLPLRPLTRSRLVMSYIVFLRQLCVPPMVPMHAEGPYLARAIADLELALVAEALDDSLDEAGIEGLRYRIRDHIGRNLSDPRLGPQSIASALGVSVRYVHRAFNTDETSVAKFVREQRLAAVADALRSERRIHRIDALSARFGFAGRDQLTRAFRAKYGTTIRAFQEAEQDADQDGDAKEFA